MRAKPTPRVPGMRRAPSALLSLAFAAAALAGCHRTPPPVPLDQLNAEQARGHGVFQARCSQCHNDRTPDPLHGPSLRGVFKKPYLPSGAPANDDRVTATLQHGRGMMPPQRDLDSADLSDLLAYLHSL